MRQRNIWFLSLLIALLIGAGIYHQTRPTSEESIRVGVVQALTGKGAEHGNRVRDGIALARKHINEAGGIDGRTIELIVEDGENDAKKAVAAFHKLIGTDKVNIILGPTGSSPSVAAASVAEENKVLMITQIASTPELKSAGDYIFRVRASGEVHGRAMADFAYNQLGAQTASILFVDLDNGHGYRDAFRKQFEKNGGTVLSTEAYQLEDNDFRSQLTKIQAVKPDVVYVAGHSAELSFRQAGELGMNMPLLSINAVEKPELFDIAGKFAEGIYYTYSLFDEKSTDPIFQSYQDAYTAEYGELSAAFAANGYDSLILVADAIKECKGDETDTSCLRDYLYDVEKYAGVSGMISFDEYGEVEKPLMIKTIQDGKFVKYE